MNGRESKEANNLFFTCSLIEYIARKTKNKRSDTVDALGRTTIEKIYDLADIYHSGNIKTVSDDFIEKSDITVGSYDNVSAAKYAVPSYPVVDSLFEAFHSFVSEKLMITTAVFTMKHPKIFLTLFWMGKLTKGTQGDGCGKLPDSNL